jgi:hypothetical protein
MDKASAGVWFEPIGEGFRLRASCRSFIDSVMRVGLAAAVSSLPFVLWRDLIRGVWTDEGASFWITCAFLAIWAAAIFYTDWIALVSLFGEIRITKAGDRGEIFTGIGKLGWTHRFRWSDFQSVSGIETRADAGRRTGTVRYVVLNAPSKRYKFGWQLSADRQAFIETTLREHVFHDSPA